MDTLLNFKKDLFNNISALMGVRMARIPSAIIAVLICYIIYKVLFDLLDKVLEKTTIEKHIQNIIKTFVKIIVFFIFIVIITSALGIDTTSIIAVFSLFGLAISLSIQNIMSNVAHAISIILNKPYMVGDYIKINEYEGNVEEISLLNTKIKTINNEMIYVPNTIMGSNTIINYTHMPNRRIQLIIDASYNDDIDKVKKALRQVIDEEPLTRKDKDIFIEVYEYSTSSIKYIVRVYCNTPDYVPCKFSLLSRIKKKFDENGITIPFQTINIQNAQ